MGLADGGRNSSSSDAVAQAIKLMHHGKLNQARYVAAHAVPAGPRYGASSCGACWSMVWSSQRRLLGHNPRHCSGTEGSGYTMGYGSQGSAPQVPSAPCDEMLAPGTSGRKGRPSDRRSRCSLSAALSPSFQHSSKMSDASEITRAKASSRGWSPRRCHWNGPRFGKVAEPFMPYFKVKYGIKCQGPWKARRSMGHLSSFRNPPTK